MSKVPRIQLSPLQHGSDGTDSSYSISSVPRAFNVPVRSWIFLFLLFCVISKPAISQVSPRSYTAYKSLSEIKIDGRADEASWDNAPWSDDFIDIEGKKIPSYRTRVKMLWDSNNLYVFAKMEEPHVWATLKQRDTVIFYNNDFEIFIDPDGDTHHYMELEVNAHNTVWDLLLSKPYRNGGLVVDHWDFKGLKTAVHILGSLNDPRDTDQGWQVEIAIPWESMKELYPGAALPENSFWRINFSRVNWDYELDGKRYSRKKDAAGNFMPEYNWVWSPQGVINMHEPEHWGYVYFSDKQGVDNIFKIPDDETLKWSLYQVYREMLQSPSRINDITGTKTIGELEFMGSKVNIHFETHNAGYNLYLNNPFNGNKLLIREDGKFIKYEN
ncbi:carbohydrate-binding family 9-like protein [Zeaxanthinibacter enoshimensis]|nr:carbohydrate-binding family 9-like protein [Zeaxanthinibacter enoshimensis]